MNNGKTGKATRNERLGRIRARLLAREQRLLAELRRLEQEGAGNVLDGADPMDAASESATNDLLARLSEFRAVELVEINDAFQKLFDGTYGMCEQCGERIPEARLRLIPAVSLCVGCASGIERRTGNPLDLREWSGAAVMAEVKESEAFSGQTRRRS